MLERGSTVAGYRIEGLLGQGGMGSVYKARQLSLNRMVALKLVGADLAGDDAYRERFRREGLMQAGIDHPHIVPVFEAGEFEDNLYIAMRLVQGPSLKDLILGRELDAARALRLLTQVADALDTAHEAGLIHRDIKPQNILVAGSDHAYLADFGLTKSPGERSLTRSGQFLGSLEYVSPEQIRDEPPSPASDVYSLTGVLYECLTGAVPYPKLSEAAVLYAHMADPPPRPSEERPELPAELDQVVALGMDKDPAERYASAGKLMAGAVAALEAAAMPVAPPPGPIEAPEEAGVREEVGVEPTEPEAEPEAEADPTAEADPGGDTPMLPAATPQAGPQATAERVPVSEEREGPESHVSEEGPTAPPPPPRASQADTVRTGAGLRARRARLFAAAGLLVILVGFFGGRLVGADGDSVRSVSAGALSLSVPSSWERLSGALSVPGLRLADAVFVGPSRGRQEGVVAGQTGATGPTLLPAPFLSRLDRPPPRNDIVRLGELDAYRYRGLKPEGFDGRLDVFVVPTTAGAATVACVAAEGRAQAFLSRCEDAAATLELSGAEAYELGPDAEFGEAVSKTMEELNRDASKARTELRRARTPGGQARATGKLRSAYAGAAAELRKPRISPADADARGAIVAALQDTATGYRRLAAAASRRSTSRYNAARRQVARGEAALRRALRSLERLGYSVKS